MLINFIGVFMANKGLNRATLIGNLGQDPELRTTPQGSNVCSFTLATSDRYKDKNGEWQDVTDWHRIVFWDKLAEIAGEYLKKGSRVFIEGKIKTRSYEKDGETKYITEIIGHNMLMLSAKEQSEVSDSGGTYYQASRPTAESHLAPDIETSADDDDVPF